MSDDQPTQEQAEAVLQQMLSTALAGVDAIGRRAAGNAVRFRQALFGGMRAGVCDVHRETSVRRVADPGLAKEQLCSQQGVATVLYLYTLVLLELAQDPNTQWNDAELLSGQFRHHLKNQCRGADCIDARSGDYIFKSGAGRRHP